MLIRCGRNLQRCFRIQRLFDLPLLPALRDLNALAVFFRLCFLELHAGLDQQLPQALPELLCIAGVPQLIALILCIHADRIVIDAYIADIRKRDACILPYPEQRC